MLKEANVGSRCLRATVSIVVASLLVFTTARGEAAAPPEELVEQARQTIIGFMYDEHLDWFHKNVKKAKALFIIPRLREGALLGGGLGGGGVLLVKDQRSGEWSQPAFYIVAGGSLGLKVGYQESEVVVMAMTKKAVDSFLKSEFKAGGDLKMTVVGGVGIAAAPKGDLISLSRSEGVLVGASFGGAQIQVDPGANRTYYGKDVSPKQILITGKVNNPQALGLRVAVTESTKTMQ